MGTQIDITGNKYGWLTVQKYAYKRKKHHYWAALCVCGCIAIVQRSNLTSGRTSSCGCKQKQYYTALSKRMTLATYDPKKSLEDQALKRQLEKTLRKQRP